PRSFEPVVELNFGALTEVRAESARAAQPGQLAGARPRHDAPIAAHDVVLPGADVLQQERALLAGDLARHPLDADEAGRAVLALRLQESGYPIALDVADELLTDMDLDELRAIGGLVIGPRLVAVDFDPAARVCLPRLSHPFPPLALLARPGPRTPREMRGSL